MRLVDDSVSERVLLFTADHGGDLLSWDLSPTREEVVVVP
jgi:hypothetical protein